MRWLSSCSAALLALVLLLVACDTVPANDCWVNTSGGFGATGTIPIGAGVGAGGGSGADRHPEKPNPCVTQGNDTVQPGATTGGTSAAAGGEGDAGAASPPSCGMGGAPPGVADYTCGGGADYTLLQGYILDADPAGGTPCANPSDCVNKCVAQYKYCWAAQAVHPYKPPMVGDLYDCIDSMPPASIGGSYTCLYRYPNGDACIFAYAAKLGPITLPAPPPLCVYKQQ